MDGAYIAGEADGEVLSVVSPLGLAMEFSDVPSEPPVVPSVLPLSPDVPWSGSEGLLGSVPVSGVSDASPSPVSVSVLGEDGVVGGSEDSMSPGLPAVTRSSWGAAVVKIDAGLAPSPLPAVRASTTATHAMTARTATPAETRAILRALDRKSVV